MPVYDQDMIRIYSGYNQDMVRICSGYDQDVIRIDQDIFRVQSGYG
jgi:hypothetical protein